MPTAEAAWSVSGHANKARAKEGEETALPAWFCLEILLHENVMIPWFGRYFVTKRLAVGNLCREVVGYRR